MAAMSTSPQSGGDRGLARPVLTCQIVTLCGQKITAQLKSRKGARQTETDRANGRGLHTHLAYGAVHYGTSQHLGLWACCLYIL